MSHYAQRPGPDEFAEYYAGYVAAVPDGDGVATLRKQVEDARARLGRVAEERADSRYAPGKWTLKEVVGHVVDVEWVFTARALRFARGDATELPGVDQDVLVAGANFASRPLASMLDEWGHLRNANTALFASLGPDQLDQRGVASGYAVSVRGILWIVAGHARHHLGVIETRYL